MSDVLFANESIFVGSVEVPSLGLSLGVPTEVNVAIAVDDSGLALNVTVGVANKLVIQLFSCHVLMKLL